MFTCLVVIFRTHVIDTVHIRQANMTWRYALLPANKKKKNAGSQTTTHTGM